MELCVAAESGCERRLEQIASLIIYAIDESSEAQLVAVVDQ